MEKHMVEMTKAKAKNITKAKMVDLINLLVNKNNDQLDTIKDLKMKLKRKQEIIKDCHTEIEHLYKVDEHNKNENRRLTIQNKHTKNIIDNFNKLLQQGE